MAQFSVQMSLILSGIFATCVASACPNLQGSWTCQFSDGATGKTSIKQSITDGVTTYTLTVHTSTSPHHGGLMAKFIR